MGLRDVTGEAAMIIGLPSEEELQTAGIDYLYMALSDAIEIAEGEKFYIDLQERSAGNDADALDLVQEYWQSVRCHLATCASLLQMGTELLLKARIAGVSPYLLLDKVASWPGRADQDAVHFDEFHTVDARVLPRVFNTVCTRRLSGQFLETFERIRRRRNAIVHAASERAVPTSKGSARRA